MRRTPAILGTLCILTLLPYGVQYLYPSAVFDPCNALRDAIRKQDGLTSDSAIESVVSTFGSLDRGKCLALVLQRPPPPLSETTEPATLAPVAALAPVIAKRAPSVAEREIVTAINACMAKRVSGELPGYAASAKCAGSRVVEALGKAN